MTSAKVYQLRPKAKAGAQQPSVAELEAVDDHPEAAVQGMVASILAHTLNIFSSDDERERTQRNAIAAFGVRVVSAGLLYLSQIVLARWMGSFEYGIYVFVWTWVLILGGLSHLGLNMAIIRLAPVYRETGEMARLRGLIHGGRLLALATGTLIMALGIAGIWLLKDHIESHFVLPAYLALVCVPLYALTDVQDGIGRGHAWMGLALLPPYVLRPVLLLAAMFAAYGLGLPMNAATAAGGAIIATWGAGLIQTLLINIAHEIGGRDRRVFMVQLDNDRANCGGKRNAHGVGKNDRGRRHCRFACGRCASTDGRDQSDGGQSSGGQSSGGQGRRSQGRSGEGRGRQG